MGPASQAGLVQCNSAGSLPSAADTSAAVAILEVKAGRAGAALGFVRHSGSLMSCATPKTKQGVRMCGSVGVC